MSKGIVNQLGLDTLTQGFVLASEETFAAQDAAAWQSLCSVSSTTAKRNEVVIMEASPPVRKWEGDKQFDEINFVDLAGYVSAYHKSYQISRLDLDNQGIVKARIDAMLADALGFYDKVVFDAILANPTCYDGTALFGASHPRVRGSTAANRTASALSFSTFDAGVTAINSLADNNSEPLNLNPDTLIVGPSNMRLGMEITGSTTRIAALNASGAEATSSVVAAASFGNVYGGGAFKLIVSKRLTGSFAAGAFLVDSSKSVKAMHLFEKRKPEIVIEGENMSDHVRFSKDMIRYSLEADLQVSPGMWQHAYRFGL